MVSLSWWNPLSWGGEAAQFLADEALDAIGAALAGATEKIKENPEIVIAPVVGVLAGVTAYHAAKTAGQEGGKKIVEKITEEDKDG